VYPPVVIYSKRKEDTPMRYLNDTQLWAEVKDYYVDWEQEAFGEPGRKLLKHMLEHAMKADVQQITGEQIFGQKRVVVTDIRSLAGNDAAYYFEKVPGVKLSFCAGFEKKENFLLHNSRFDFDDEKIIPLALKALYGLIMRIK
jgi:metal-dependent amidase/aminoacylase/carboxypeptidase family protein